MDNAITNIPIKGGNVQVLPNAGYAIQYNHPDAILPTPSGLTQIVESLSKERLSDEPMQWPQPLAFKVEDKINANHLGACLDLIRECAGNESILNNIYNVYESEGRFQVKGNVLFNLRVIYNRCQKDVQGEDLFYRIIDEAVKIVLQSSNRGVMSMETILRGVAIVVAHAFCLCKIFKNPVGYAYP